MGIATYKQGKGLEDRLRYLHGQYEEAEFAVVAHNGLTAVYTGKGVKVRKSTPDYTGTLSPLGRAVWFDAKSTTKERYRHSSDRLHQLHWLYTHSLFGAAAFLLVASETRGWILWPQGDWGRGEPYSVKLVDLPDDSSDPVGCICPAWPYAMQDMIYIPDWLAVVRQRFTLD